MQTAQYLYQKHEFFRGMEDSNISYDFYAKYEQITQHKFGTRSSAMLATCATTLPQQFPLES